MIINKKSIAFDMMHSTVKQRTVQSSSNDFSFQIIFSHDDLYTSSSRFAMEVLTSYYNWHNS